MSKLLALLLAGAFAICSAQNLGMIVGNNVGNTEIDLVCINNIEYILAQGTYDVGRGVPAITIALDKNLKPITCY